jgi:hypothetical protein
MNVINIVVTVIWNSGDQKKIFFLIMKNLYNPNYLKKIS